jgi:hypothetical protein
MTRDGGDLGSLNLSFPIDLPIIFCKPDENSGNELGRGTYRAENTEDYE